MSRSNGRYCRNKGHNWERRVAKDLRKAYGEEDIPANESSVRRGQQGGGGAIEPDVRGPREWAECKKGKKTMWRTAFNQAKDDWKKAKKAGYQGETIPLAICRDDNQEPVVILRWADFLIMIQERKQSGDEDGE